MVFLNIILNKRQVSIQVIWFNLLLIWSYLDLFIVLKKDRHWNLVGISACFLLWFSLSCFLRSLLAVIIGPLIIYCFFGIVAGA